MRLHQSSFTITVARALGLALLMSGLMAGVRAAEPSFAERLGWKPSDVVVILHVDDVGMSHASNLGAIESVEKGVATSWAVMMPCPWVPEIAKYLAENPGVDSGLHLTLTSEWKLYRWGPLAGKARVPGLTDREGCLWPSVLQVVQRATPDEIELEIRAQIDRARILGMPITHLDSHMGTLFARPDYFERFAKVGMEEGIPILAVGGHMTHARKENPEAVAKLRPWIPKIWNAGLPVLDDLFTNTGAWKRAEKKHRLMELLKSLRPGVTEILFHSSRLTEELPVITGSSESRMGDLEALTSPEVRALIQERNILQTTWKELAQRRKAAKAIAETLPER
ncbi:MAG: ChbG/HpnK family deacetylase [Verrucomicrobia bacterium]|nr:ChbG/HpnK family deacetylase [Verrucomicrobiota bacterium]